MCSPSPVGFDHHPLAAAHAASVRKMSYDPSSLAGYHALTQEEARELLFRSSYTEGKAGSPGTFLVINSASPTESGKTKYDVLFVNDAGEIDVRTATRHLDERWVNGAPDTYYEKFDALLAHFMEGVTSLGADSLAIPVYTSDEETRIKGKLTSTLAPLSFVIYATPNSAAGGAGDDKGATSKRCKMVWISEKGDCKQAEFHYDYATRRWVNGAPAHLVKEALAASSGGGGGGTTLAPRASEEASGGDGGTGGIDSPLKTRALRSVSAADDPHPVLLEMFKQELSEAPTVDKLFELAKKMRRADPNSLAGLIMSKLGVADVDKALAGRVSTVTS